MGLVDWYREHRQKSYDKCLEHIKKTKGVNSCTGLMGGDKSVQYLAHACVDCPYMDWSVYRA